MFRHILEAMDSDSTAFNQAESENYANINDTKARLNIDVGKRFPLQISAI